MSIKQQDKKAADQRVHPKEPETFPSQEAANEVVGYNRERYMTLMQHYREQDWRAAQKLREQQDLESRLAQVKVERAHAEAEAATARNAADGPRMVLERFGVGIPQLPAVEMPPAPQGTPQQIANWNGPETGSFTPPDPFANNQHDGHCINCGKEAWIAPVAPRGATHSFGPTCDPNSPESTYADLGNPPAGGAVQ